MLLFLEKNRYISIKLIKLRDLRSGAPDDENLIDMKKIQKILNKISQLTVEIEVKYPGLYRNLDENPMAIPAIGDPSMDESVFSEYLDGLRQLVKRYLESQRIREKPIL